MTFLKRNHMFAIALILACILIPNVVFASGTTYEVGTTNLTVRATPSTDGEILGQLNPGNQVVVFNEKYGWAETYYNGQTAYVAAQYLYQANGNDSAPSTNSVATRNETVNPIKQSVTITANNVRLRTGPGTTYNMSGSLQYGETLRLLSTEGDWHRVSATDGTTGWVASWLTDTQIAGSSQAPTATTAPDTTQSTPRANGSLQGFNIVIDAGHGGNDPGASGINNLREKDLTLAMSNAIASSLRQAGANVIMTRTSDTYVSLAERVQISHAYNTHAFLSIHYNAYPIYTINGFSTHYYSGGQDRELAHAIQAELEQNINLYSRGIMQDNYYVLRENRNLSVLLELGFITNLGDVGSIQSASYENQVAKSVTNALLKYFN